MVKQKYYAVKIGKSPGIYSTWKQTEEQVKGFSGAKYKSFETEKEALEYLSKIDKERSQDESEDINSINEKIENEISNLKEDEVIAFVDGSYCPDINGKEKYSFGVLLKTKDSENSLYKAYVEKEYIQSKNIAGEIEGVKQAILWSINANKNKIKIFYDCEGIEKWATKQWKANTRVSKDYVEFFEINSKKIKIDFVHTKAHSGIIYNEKADELAKKALYSHGYKSYNDGSVYFTGFNKEDWLKMINLINIELENENIKESIIVNESKPKEYLEILKLNFNNDKVTINCYKGSKSYVQGKDSLLFEKVISVAISELESDNEVLETLNTYHALTITEQEVEYAFSSLLPDFPEDHNDSKLKRTLLTAVFNTLITGYIPEYTFLLTPIFRSMECYLHKILGEKLELDTERVTTNQKVTNNFGFFCFDDNMKAYVYNADTKHLNDKQIEYLNELYNRYNKNRHPYSHWRKDSVDVSIITDINTAHDLIKENLKFINKYYIIF